MDCFTCCLPIFYPQHHEPEPQPEPPQEENVLYIVELPQQPQDAHPIEPPERPATPGFSPSPSAPTNDSFMRPKKNEK
jgi:hypothetical protein